MSPRALRALRWAMLGWIIVFWRLGYPALLDPDEAHYAELTREMLHSGSWLVPLLDGRPFIDKPVLFHWLQGASVWLLGETEFAARLPTALAAIGLVAMTRWVGAALFGATVGESGALMFLTLPATVALSTVALFDMVFTLFLFGAIGCLMVAARTRGRRLEYSGYALLTLAVMTKGPVALILVFLFLAAAAVATRGTDVPTSALRWKTGLATVAVLASPWFVWMYFRFGWQFVEAYLFAGNLWYFTQPATFSARAISHTFYARTFAGAFFPWSAVVVGRLLDHVMRWRALRSFGSGGEVALWIWVFVVLGFFSAARFKLDHYIFPAAPACCLLAARAWSAAAESEAPWPCTRGAVIAAAGALVFAASFGCVYLFQLDLDLPPISILLPISLGCGGIGLLVQMARRRWMVPASAAVLVVALAAAYATVVAIGYPALEETRPTARVARRLAATTPDAAPVGLYRLERWRASLRYYLDRPIARIEAPEELRTFLSQPQPVYVVMLRRDYEDLRKAGVRMHLLMQQRAVVGTAGRMVRKQKWGFLVVATNTRPARAVPE